MIFELLIIHQPIENTPILDNLITAQRDKLETHNKTLVQQLFPTPEEVQ